MSRGISIVQLRSSENPLSGKKMKFNTLLFRTFVIFMSCFVTTAQAEGGEITYEECPTIEYIDMKTGKIIDPLFAPAVLCATINGFVYEIVEPNWAQYPQMGVREVVDLDGDGWDEALVQVGTGGNGCCWENYLISYRGNGFFVTDTNEFISRANSFKVKTYKGEKLLQAIDRGFGDRSSYSEELREYSLDFGRLVLKSTVVNKASIQIEAAITNQNVMSDNLTSIKLFIDEDDLPDELKCEVWGRYNLLHCEILIDGKQSYGLPSSCEIIAISPQRTNGLKDVVCNLTQGYQFDGEKSYEFAPPPS